MNKSYCESEGNINDFIRELTVDFWTLQDTIDLSLYGKNPTYKSFKYLG